tara:strand:- start:24289 stop:25632 length:1344 start_codon:yes stop_codon:yes gene_type:complete
MKNFYVGFLALLCVGFTYAQVGIGTVNPHSSSILDISSPDKGILIPRIDLGNLTTTSPITNPVKSLMVWNTDAANGGANEGFYFWTGADWNTIATSGGSGSSGDSWSMSGNNISGSDFLGTTNYSSLRMRVNNNEVSSYHPNGGISIGLQSNANPNNALALGRLARANSNEALAVGYDALASGYQSMAVGNYATATSNNATALGHSSEATGQNSSALGYDSRATGQNAMAVGTGALANQANTLILGNNTPVSSWDGTRIGIGTSNPTEKLHVQGAMRIVDGNQGAGKVLTSDANGRATWQEVGSAGGADTKRFAEIYKTSGPTGLSQSNAIAFGQTTIADGINAANNNFQVPVAGLYRVSYSVTLEKTDSGKANPRFFLSIGWGNNNVPGSEAHVVIRNNEVITVSKTKLVHLNAWQQLYLFTDTTDPNIRVQPNGTTFTIELVKAD